MMPQLYRFSRPLFLLPLLLLVDVGGVVSRPRSFLPGSFTLWEAFTYQRDSWSGLVYPLPTFFSRSANEAGLTTPATHVYAPQRQTSQFHHFGGEIHAWGRNTGSILVWGARSYLGVSVCIRSAFPLKMQNRKSRRFCASETEPTLRDADQSKSWLARANLLLSPPVSARTLARSLEMKAFVPPLCILFFRAHALLFMHHPSPVLSQAPLISISLAFAAPGVMCNNANPSKKCSLNKVKQHGC